MARGHLHSGCSTGPSTCRTRHRSRTPLRRCGTLRHSVATIEESLAPAGSLSPSSRFRSSVRGLPPPRPPAPCPLRHHHPRRRRRHPHLRDST
eukprot:4028529-Prymnesium_polylepis.1